MQFQLISTIFTVRVHVWYVYVAVRVEKKNTVYPCMRWQGTYGMASTERGFLSISCDDPFHMIMSVGTHKDSFLYLRNLDPFLYARFYSRKWQNVNLVRVQSTGRP